MINEKELDNLIQKLKKQKDEVESNKYNSGDRDYYDGNLDGITNTLEQIVEILESFKPKE